MLTLNWNLDLSRGRLTFGRLRPATGNTYRLEVSGGSPAAAYTFYVMSEDGETCLAKSRADAQSGCTIAFDTADLRGEFCQAWHEVRHFHTVASDGENTVAEGDLAVCWNPVWTDRETGEAYSMRAKISLPDGSTMPARPTQRQLAAAVQALWTLLGGSVAENH